MSEIDINETVKQIVNAMHEYAQNNIERERLRIRNSQLESFVVSMRLKVREHPIQLTAEPSQDLAKGERCWICKKIASARCIFCFHGDKPAGYCVNHVGRHKRHFPDHNAVMQGIVAPETTINHVEHKTPEQIIAELEALNAQLDKELEQLGK